MVLSMRSVTLRVEAATGGTRTAPMIVVDTGVTGTVTNWSSKMKAHFTASLTVRAHSLFRDLNERYNTVCRLPTSTSSTRSGSR